MSLLPVIKPLGPRGVTVWVGQKSSSSSKMGDACSSWEEIKQCAPLHSLGIFHPSLCYLLCEELAIFWHRYNCNFSFDLYYLEIKPEPPKGRRAYMAALWSLSGYSKSVYMENIF